MQRSGQFKNLLEAWKNCFQAFKHVKIFLVFFIYAFLQIGFILIFMFYAYPPFSSFMKPLLQKFFGEFALHYPAFFLVLPNLFSWTNILLSGVFGIVLVGVTTVLFARSYHQKQPDLNKGFRRTMSNYLLLFAVWLVETGILLGVFMGVPKLLAKLEMFAIRDPIWIQLATSMIAIVVATFFIYTTALVMLENSTVPQAIGRSFSMFFRYPVVSLLLVAIPSFIKMPLELLSGKAQFLISKFTPEMVGVILILSVLVSMFANYFLVGTVTRYFLLVNVKR